jgi:hypothetical protein
MMIPDEIFWKKVEEQMMESYGHPLNQQELAIVCEQGWGPLEKLVKESPVLGKV